MNRLKIGTVTALLTPSELNFQIDDRQERIQTVEHDGTNFVPAVAVVDGGYCDTGATLSLSGVVFTLTDWATIYGYWQNRTSVSVTDATGTVNANCRILLKGWKQSKQFPASITADLEVWRV